MTIRWKDGHILWSGGHIAHSDDCCCGVESEACQVANYQTGIFWQIQPRTVQSWSMVVATVGTWSNATSGNCSPNCTAHDGAHELDKGNWPNPPGNPCTQAHGAFAGPCNLHNFGGANGVGLSLKHINAALVTNDAGDVFWWCEVSNSVRQQVGGVVFGSTARRYISTALAVSGGTHLTIGSFTLNSTSIGGAPFIFGTYLCDLDATSITLDVS